MNADDITACLAIILLVTYLVIDFFIQTYRRKP